MTTKQDIIDCSIKLFAEYGFENTSIAKISETAGLSRGAGGIYRHFASKLEILQTIFAQYEQTTIPVFQHYDDIKSTLDLSKIERIHLYLKFVYSHLLSHKDIIKIWVLETRHFSQKEIDLKNTIRLRTVSAIVEVGKTLIENGASAQVNIVPLAHTLMDIMTARVCGLTRVVDLDDEEFIRNLAEMTLGKFLFHDTKNNQD